MQFRIWVIAVLAALAAAVAGSTQTANAGSLPFTAEHLEQKLDQIILQAMDEMLIPGTAVVVTWQDSIFFSKGYGYADLERQLPMEPQSTILPLGSLTKTLTAASIIQLAEQQLLDLNTDIQTYTGKISFGPYADQPVTLHHLLTHTAGLDDIIYSVVAKNPHDMAEIGTFLQHYLRTQPPVGVPGKEYAYSNAALGLAAYLIELRTGLSYEAYVSRNLFDPLQMPSAAINAEPASATARSYHNKNNTLEPVPYSYINLPGAGGVSATPAEWANFLIALLNGGRYQDKQILTPEAVDMMQSRQFTEHPNLEGVGYGFFRKRLDNGQLALWHNGDVDGFSSKMELIPAEQLGILVVTNAPSRDASLHDKVIEAITALLPNSGWQQPLVKSEDLTRFGIVHDVPWEAYEGQYTLTLAPKHGWGKWLRWLGYRDFHVKSAKEGLLISGPLPDGAPESKQRLFRHIGNGLFQDKETREHLFFRDSERNGKRQLVFPLGVSILQQTDWWRHPKVSLGSYLFIGLCWVIIFVGVIVRTITRLLRRKPALKSLNSVLWLSGIFVIYFMGQLLYGNSNAITLGYPGWYIWGFSSLPLAAVFPAIALLRRALHPKLAMSYPNRPFARLQYKQFAAFCAILYAGSVTFLYYWNMLSIH